MPCLALRLGGPEVIDNHRVTEAWRWDETLYAGSAAHYVVGRVPYPRELGERIAAAVRLRGRERAIDVGCGPGSLTLLLAGFVEHIVGIDADAEMVNQAISAARREGVANVSWRRMRGEDLPADLGSADLVTFAQSFHWMDRLQVAGIVRDMLVPGGSCVHVHATTHRGDASVDPLPRPRPPYEEIEALVRSYLGGERRAGRTSLPHGTPQREADVFRQAGFDGPTHFEVPRGEVIERSIEEVMAATFSLSSSTPHLFGAYLPEFEAKLRALLRAASDDGQFCERVRDIAFDVWRPHKTSGRVRG
jgi:SAM-dependent methyltransferase